MRYLNPEIDFSLSIVKISAKITISRIILLILIFIPLFIMEILPKAFQNYMGALSGIFMMTFILVINFIPNYNKVGSLDFYNDYFKISITREDIKVTNNSIVRINYNGFKGDHFMRKFTRQGINEIQIEQDNAKFNFKFLSTDIKDLPLLSKFKSRFGSNMTIDVSGENIL